MQGLRVICVLALLAIIPGQQTHSEDLQRTFQTRSGKEIIVTEKHPKGLSLSDMRIVSHGFMLELDETIRDSDPLGNVVMSDLDEDGFEEIYLITVSAGSGSYGSIQAYSSNRDRSLSSINFPEIQDGDDRFSGYRGHDEFEFQTHRLVRRFPVYLEQDSNHQATGGQQAVYYELVPGEAMPQLVIVGSEQIN